MPQYGFGSGSLFGVNTTTANSTPQKFGALQDVTLDFSFTSKELRGQYQFPLTVARGTGKITGKAKFGQISAKLFNDLFFGGSGAVQGKVMTVIDEAGTITANTITVANGATFVDDLGCYEAATGVPFVKVASAPAAGQYSVSAVGVYTFAAGDTGKAMRINYTYTVAASGYKTTISNQLIGAAPKFKVILNDVYEGKNLTVVLNACTSSKLQIATKLEDFIIPELDFECMADASNTVGTISIDDL